MADHLESLNNSSLREQCIKFGLPNVPVTDSSRKVLIRKLRKSMESSRVTFLQSTEPKNQHVLLKENIQNPSRPEKSKGAAICLRKNDIVYTNPSDSEKFLKFEKHKSFKTPHPKDHDYLMHLSSAKSVEFVNHKQALPVSSFNQSSDLFTRQTLGSDTNDYSVKSPQHRNSSIVKTPDPGTLTSTTAYNIFSQTDTVPTSITRRSSHCYEDGLIKTPYLSNFARTLEQLKVDKLGGATMAAQVHNNRVGYPSSVNFESKAGCDTVGRSFHQFLFALNRTYHLKRNLIILIFCLLVLFIYVIFIM